MSKELLLSEFLVESNKAGYAGGDSKKWTKEKDGSTTIVFESGPWKSHDNFFGGEPYGGRIIVTKEGKPYWIMIYYGWVKEGIDPKEIYPILQEALKEMPDEHPFRGPEEYKKDNYTYKNKWEGDVERYSGEEEIVKGSDLVYKANYMGGLVDQRK